MKDYIVRAIAADSQIRAFAAVTTETVETARQDHNTSPVATAALGRLLTAGTMMGVMMKGDKDILTLQGKGDGPVSYTHLWHEWTETTRTDGRSWTWNAPDRKSKRFQRFNGKTVPLYEPL